MARIPEAYKPVYREIMTTLQRKYNHMTEVCRLTAEIEGALQRDDRVSTQMLIEMRQVEIEGLQQSDKALQLVIESTPEDMRQWLNKAVSGTVSQDEAYDTEENLILRVAGNIRGEWEKTMRIDRHVNQRLAGADSFYQGQPEAK